MIAHTWKTLPGGDIDDFALDVEGETTGHNGPKCTVCGFSFCKACAKIAGVDPMDPEQYSCPDPDGYI